MTIKHLSIAVGSLTLLGLGLSSRVGADEWDKKTTMTVNAPIQVPGKVLPAGRYVFKLLNSPSDRHIVQIFNADGTELQTTVLAIPNERLKPTGNTVFTFWEVPPGQPAALRAWFYPGDVFGQEFVYPKMAAIEIAAAANTNVPIVEAKTEPELETAPVAEVTPQGVEEPLPTAPAETAQVIPEPAAAEPVVAELPKTASPYPMIALAGLLSLVAFAVVRVIRTS